MRIAVKILEPISGPFGSYVEDLDGNREWVYCRLIEGKWYFETIQKVDNK